MTMHRQQTCPDLVFQDLRAELMTTRRVLERIPDEHLAWKPHPRSWSLGELASHVANLPRWIYTTLRLEGLDLANSGTTISEPADRSELLERFDSDSRAAEEAVAGADWDNLMAPWTLRQGERELSRDPKAAVLRRMCLSHMVHHRGQLTVYLRLLDVPIPPIYGRTADEPGAGGASPPDGPAANRSTPTEPSGTVLTSGVRPVERRAVVPLSVGAAFEWFVDHLHEWWPPEYTWSGDVLEGIGIEPRNGGWCWEEGPDGFRCTWGRVIGWDPPHRFVISWQISPRRIPEPDPSKASEVEVRFIEKDADRTRVRLVHREWERHGEGADEYQAAMSAPEGWTYLLDQYARSVS